MPYKIITHAGKAHMDELLAAALLAIHKNELPYEVIRMDHQEAERIVANGEVPEDAYVIDCGMKFDLENRLFDHHQDAHMVSAALIILNQFFPHLEKTSLHYYFKMVSDVDRYGETILPDSEYLNESREYWQFISNLALKSFEINPAETLKLISASLKYRIDFEELRRKAKIWMNTPGNLAVEKVEGVNGLVYMQIPSADIMEGLHSVDAEIIEQEKISFVYGFDKKNKNVRTLYRTQIGGKCLDLARCRPGKNIFTHQRGFLLKFAPLNDEEWQKMVKQAIYN